VTPLPEPVELLSFILDAAPGLVAYVDAEERYRYVNRTYEEWHRTPRSAWLGRTLREQLGEAAYPAMEPHVRAALAGERVRYLRSLTYPDGITRIVEASYVPHVLPGGQVLGFVSFVRDVTAHHALAQERERAADALRESEARHRQIFQGAGVSIWEEDFTEVRAALERLKQQGVTDMRAWLTAHPESVQLLASLVRVVDVNDASLRMFGARERAELLASLPRVFVPETLGSFREQLAALAEGERSFEGEAVVQTLTGERIDVLLTLTLPLAEAPHRALVTLMDIRARKAAERRVKLLANMSEAFQVGTDLRAALNTVARRTSEALGSHVACGLMLRNEQRGALEVVAMYHPDPEALELLRATSERVPWQAGSPSERVALTGQAMLVPHVPPRLPDSADPSSPLHAYLARYGLTSLLAVPLRAQGRTIGVLTASRGHKEPPFTPADQDFLQELADRAALVISNARLLDETQAARVRAEEASRLKDEFLATLSHELRTPLTAMLGWVQMLRGGVLGPDKQQKAFEIIERNTHAQAQLVEDILDVSRIITGKLRLEARPVELVQVVEAAVESVRPASDARGVSLHVLIDSSVSTVLGDPTRLQQIIWNLLSNAVKFTPKGGQVRVSVEKKDSTAVIQVSDTGQGIARDFLPHVFERFRQADSTTTRTHSGLGLGLAIVKHLVELHGGGVDAFSEGPGQGSRFTVRLPFMAALPPAESTQAPTPPEATPPEPGGLKPPPGLAGLHVLVVDDEEDAREMLRILLRNCGLRVSVASSASEGLRLLRSERPEVLVSDIGMPGEDGYTLLQKVRALTPEEGGRTPAVALTAYSRAEDRTRALRAGFNMHLPKPVEPAELLLVLASVTGRQAPSSGP
jgi:PAS domain S-box-containing protein